MCAPQMPRLPTHAHPKPNHPAQARIILGDMKIGLKKDTALKLFGNDGPQRLDANHDLRRLCAEFALKYISLLHAWMSEGL